MNSASSTFLLLLIFAVGNLSPIYAQRPSRAKRQAATKSPTPSNEEFDKIKKAADDARIAGRLDDAIQTYTNAVSMRPKWADGWWYLGALQYQKDLYPQAQDAFAKLVVLEPNRGPAWAMLGLCQFQTRDYESASRSLERGYSLGLSGNKELSSVVIYHSALLYSRFEQFETAFDVLRQLDAPPDSPPVVEAFGLIILRMPLLPKQIPSDRREEVLIAGRAGANMAARRMDVARTAFDELVARFPADPNAHYSFGVFVLSQEADLALSEFKRAQELDPNHWPALVQLAFEFLKRREYDEALPLAQKAVELAPLMYAARNVFGRVLLELGQTARAIQELEEGIRLAPASPEMHFALARAYGRAGRKQEAARENDIFKKLQDKYSQRTNFPQTGDTTGTKPERPHH